MTSLPIQRCHCDAATVWADTQNDQRLQVDACPSPLGTYRLEVRPGRSPLAIGVPAAEQAGRTDLHRHHHMTCRGGSKPVRSRGWGKAP